MDEDKVELLSKYIMGMEIISTNTDAQVTLDNINTYADDLWNKDKNIAKPMTRGLGVNELLNLRKSLYATGVSKTTPIPKLGHSGVYYDKSLATEDSKLTLDELRVQAEALGYALVKIEYESTDLTGTNKIKLN